VTCNYYKKSGHVKTECRALKAKNGKFTYKGNLPKEVNFCGSSSTTLRSTIGDTLEDDPNILNVESTIDVEVLLTTEDATSWLLDSGASYHVTSFRTQFRSYMARSLDPVVVPYGAGSSRELDDDHWGPRRGEVENDRERSRWVEKGL
jgi:hypothetical protein